MWRTDVNTWAAADNISVITGNLPRSAAAGSRSGGGGSSSASTPPRRTYLVARKDAHARVQVSLCRVAALLRRLHRPRVDEAALQQEGPPPLALVQTPVRGRLIRSSASGP